MGAGFPHFFFRSLMACRRSEAGSLLAPLRPLRPSIRCRAASAPPLTFPPNSAFAASSIGTYSAPAGVAWDTVSLLPVFCISFTSCLPQLLKCPRIARKDRERLPSGFLVFFSLNTTKAAVGHSMALYGYNRFPSLRGSFLWGDISQECHLDLIAPARRGSGQTFRL